MTQTRVQRGVPTGGQFCASTRPESSLALDGRPVYVNIANSDAVARRASVDEVRNTLTPGSQRIQVNVFDGVEDLQFSHRVHINRVHERGVDVTYPGGNGGGPAMRGGDSYAIDQYDNVFILDDRDEPYLVYRAA